MKIFFGFTESNSPGSTGADDRSGRHAVAGGGSGTGGSSIAGAGARRAGAATVRSTADGGTSGHSVAAGGLALAPLSHGCRHQKKQNHSIIVIISLLS